MAPFQMSAEACQTSHDLDEAAWGDARDCMEAYANATAEELMMMLDALHFGNWTRAVVRGRAVMIVPLNQSGRRRKVPWGF